MCLVMIDILDVSYLFFEEFFSSKFFFSLKNVFLNRNVGYTPKVLVDLASIASILNSVS